MFGNIFGGFFGGKSVPDADMHKMMDKPEVRKLVSELQSRLSPEDQKELVKLIVSGDQSAVKNFFASKIPDLEQIVRDSGLHG